jgi:hypothetical protein
MKKGIIAVCLVLALCLLAVAATAPNFSGTWIRDKAKSDPMGMGGPGGRGGPGGPGGPPPGGAPPADIEVTVKVNQQGNVFQVTTMRGDRSTEMNYTLDGKENTNPSQRGNFVSKSKWNASTLVIEGVRKFSGQNGEMQINSKEEWSLSADGKVLTVMTTTTGSPMGDRKQKQVYNKK